MSSVMRGDELLAGRGVLSHGRSHCHCLCLSSKTKHKRAIFVKEHTTHVPVFFKV